MGLFDKVKELFSDGGVEISGQLTPNTSLSTGAAQGSVSIAGKNPDTVKQVIVSLNKRTSIQQGSSVAENSDEQIGIATIDNPGTFAPNQPLNIPFQLDFKSWTGESKNLQGATEHLQQEGGALGKLSKGLDVVSGTKREYKYYLNVVAQVASRTMTVSKEVEVTVNA